MMIELDSRQEQMLIKILEANTLENHNTGYIPAYRMVESSKKKLRKILKDGYYDDEDAIYLNGIREAVENGGWKYSVRG